MLESQDLKDFSITTWYKTFKNITLNTILIEIPPELLNYLRSDDFDGDIKTVCNSEYINNLKDALKRFDNKVFAKNNWRAPLDAKFMSLSNLLQVNCIEDLINYFKASDVVMNDFYGKYDEGYCFALREFLNIHPASEFRCIVVGDILRGITPRDWPTYYGHFAEEGPNIIRLISEFFQGNLKGKFIRKNYVFDVIITYPSKVELVDLSPLNNKTNLNAFLWEEIDKLIKMDSREMVAPVFRYLESDKGIILKPK
ncbi:translation initiation factor eIF2 assembly protein-like [Onthophagus taurus]|uniref:translation initiation factor eIF2 assembly protein-like n=1 Tax=Onthophagus taurus TaxID=166361 RepID=UPI000C200182|nr:cell division cycle protein 123 homolog [Onthophagus taurus]